MDPLVGRTLDNKYLIEKLLGKGGMGSVYQALHTGTKRTVAVKVIAPQFMRNRELLIRFQREAEASGRLRHPNVVNVTDFGVTVVETTPVAYLVMEFLDGETLHEYLQRNRNIPASLALDVLEQIALGVTEAHSLGILHRDLKPQNIWLQPDGRGGFIVKVLDFGIAKLADPSALSLELPELEAAPNVETPNGADENATVILAPTEMGVTSAFAEASGFTTTAGATLGTPAFMSPEQCSGKAVSEKSDLYSLAMLAYLMLAGELPFQGNARELIDQQIAATPDPPHKRNAKLGELVSRVILESLAKDPERRAPSLTSFVSRVRAAVEGEVSLLRESRAQSGSNSAVWFTLILVTVLPAGFALSLYRQLIRFALEGGYLEEWAAFVAVLPGHMLIAYFAMIWADIGITAWLARDQQEEAAFRPWLEVIWDASRAFPKALLAAVFTLHPIRHGLAHVILWSERLSPAQAQARSAHLVQGMEHIVFALVLRRVAVAWLVALYLPIVLIAIQAPLRVVYRETIGEGANAIFSMASFSFMPIYGSFVMAWNLLYQRAKRSQGELDNSHVRRYRPETGRIGKSIRLGTQLWSLVPLLLTTLLLGLPAIGWNERPEDNLSFAVRDGRYKDAQAFLDNGSDPNEGRGPGGDTLIVAVQNGDLPMARLLVARGARLNRNPRTPGPLHYAVLRRRPEMVRLLVELGADIEAADDRDRTPIMLAAQNGQLDVVRLLREKGAQPRNAAQLARRQGHEEIARFLEQP
jgi:serine/threonine protein kinase